SDDPQADAVFRALPLLAGLMANTPIAPLSALPAPLYPHGHRKSGSHFIQAVLGEGIAQEIGNDLGRGSLKVGDTFQLGADRPGEDNCVVAGIMKTSGTTFASEIWAKSQIVGELFGKASVFTTVVIRTHNADSAQKMSQALKESKKITVTAQPETEYYAK